MLTRIETKKGPWNITDPSWPVYVPILDKNGIYTSDDFTTTATLVGSKSDARLGGAPRIWEGSAGAWSRSGGRLTSVGAGSVGFTHPLRGVTVEATVATVPTSDAIYLEAAAVGAPTGSRTDAARIQARLTGNMRLMRRHASQDAVYGDSVAYKVGDRIGIQVRPGKIALLLNGSEVSTMDDATDWQSLGPIFAGLTTTIATNAALENFVVRGTI